MPPPAVDHLVYATPDLDGSVAQMEALTGVRASPGGRHMGLGTHNALIALGPDFYLEIIGPDPAQPKPERARPFGIDTLPMGRLVTWAVKAPGIDERVTAAKAAGYDPGVVVPLSRDTPDGAHLAWRLTMGVTAGAGLVPFLIDWGSTPSPALGAAKGCSLVALRGEHPNPAEAVGPLRALGISLAITAAPAPALIAAIETPKGLIELR